MKYIVYLTKNKKSKVNGEYKIYIGVHKTKDPNIFDGYIGCGIYINQPSTYMYPKTPLQYAVKKYGIESFERTTLYIFDTAEEAYKKEAELVDINFLKLSHTYNACLGGNYYNNYKPLYQFDLTGKLKKKWDFSIEAYEFYTLPMEKFEYAIHDKHPLVDSLWATSDTINITEYSTKSWGEPKVTHLYNKDGKWLGEFISRKACGEFIGVNEEVIVKAIKQQSLVSKKYYVSYKMVDIFIPKARIQYTKLQIYVYNKNGNLIGQGIGKEIMPIINEYSWNTIRDAFRYKDGWYKEFYLSFEKITTVPERTKGSRIKVDVFDKYGNYIETLDTVKETREKYKIPASKIKNLEMGDRYYENWIFKYHNKIN